MSETFDQWYDKHRYDIQEWANSSSYQNIARQAWDAAAAGNEDVIARLTKENKVLLEYVTAEERAGIRRGEGFLPTVLSKQRRAALALCEGGE